jgi:hypothetical protein
MGNASRLCWMPLAADVGYGVCVAGLREWFDCKDVLWLRWLGLGSCRWALRPVCAGCRLLPTLGMGSARLDCVKAYPSGLAATMSSGRGGWVWGPRGWALRPVCGRMPLAVEVGYGVRVAGLRERFDFADVLWPRWLGLGSVWMGIASGLQQDAAGRRGWVWGL